MSQRRLPAEVYWRRRLLVLAVVLLLAWFATKAFGAFGAESRPGEPVAGPTATPPTAATEATPVNGEVTVNLTGDTKPCDPEKVRVSPSVRSGQYVGSEVDVSMIVSTTQKDACVLDAKKADLLVVISATKNPVWDSSVCKSALLTKPVAVSPRWSTVAAVKWTGRGSGKDCSGRQGFASQGTYVIKSATIGGEPGQARFRLVNKPKPTVTKATPSEKPTQKQSD
ncbi:MAG: hypothetical protein ACXWXJ_05615 [Aeromicrobium sp.]